MPRPSRRALILGGGGLVAAGAAGFGVSRLVATDGSDLGDDVVLAAFFAFSDPVVAAGIEQRLVFGLLDATGPVNQGAPNELALTVGALDGEPLTDRIMIEKHQTELPARTTRCA